MAEKKENVRIVSRANPETGHPETVELRPGDMGYDNVSPSIVEMEYQQAAQDEAAAKAEKGSKK